MRSHNLIELYMWIDALHVVYEYIRGGGGGGFMSFGVVIIHSKSSKQNLNTKITTESEVVEVSEYVPYKNNMNNIFLGTGYTLHKTHLYQDNKSAIKMEKNGRNSCTGNSKHISIINVLVIIVWIRKIYYQVLQHIGNTCCILH